MINGTLYENMKPAESCWMATGFLHQDQRQSDKVKGIANRPGGAEG